jgi:predicted nucleotidyltransferase
MRNTGTEKIDRFRGFCFYRSMKNIFDQQLLRQFSQQHGLQLLVLFGSQASGKTHPKSDTDIGFVSTRKKNLLETITLQSNMSRAFAVRDLDLVDLRTVSPLFLKNIADSGVVLYEEHPGLFAELRMYAFKLFVESKPIRAASLKHFLQTV